MEDRSPSVGLAKTEEKGGVRQEGYVAGTWCCPGYGGKERSLGQHSGDAGQIISSGQFGNGKGGLSGGLSGAMQGASLGAAIGSVIPGVGTVIGGVVGAVAGFIGGLFGIVNCFIIVKEFSPQRHEGRKKH